MCDPLLSFVIEQSSADANKLAVAMRRLARSASVPTRYLSLLKSPFGLSIRDRGRQFRKAKRQGKVATPDVGGFAPDGVSCTGRLDPLHRFQCHVPPLVAPAAALSPSLSRYRLGFRRAARSSSVRVLLIHNRIQEPYEKGFDPLAKFLVIDPDVGP